MLLIKLKNSRELIPFCLTISITEQIVIAIMIYFGGNQFQFLMELGILPRYHNCFSHFFPLSHCLPFYFTKTVCRLKTSYWTGKTQEFRCFSIYFLRDIKGRMGRNRCPQVFMTCRVLQYMIWFHYLKPGFCLLPDYLGNLSRCNSSDIFG
jgi:hypothetical protein